MTADDLDRQRLDRRTKTGKVAYRAELRSAGEEEDSRVIHQTAIERAPKSTSTPPKAKILLALLNARPSAGMVLIILALIAALFGGGLLRPAFDHVIGWTTR